MSAPTRTPGTQPATIREAREVNHAMYGPPAEARAYADDMGDVFCEDCHGVYHVLPGYARDGHQCLTDGTTDAYVLPGSYGPGMADETDAVEREDAETYLLAAITAQGQNPEDFDTDGIIDTIHSRHQTFDLASLSEDCLWSAIVDRLIR